MITRLPPFAVLAFLVVCVVPIKTPSTVPVVSLGVLGHMFSHLTNISDLDMHDALGDRQMEYIWKASPVAQKTWRRYQFQPYSAILCSSEPVSDSPCIHLQASHV